jgi:hypothetical protein
MSHSPLSPLSTLAESDLKDYRLPVVGKFCTGVLDYSLQTSTDETAQHSSAAAQRSRRGAAADGLAACAPESTIALCPNQLEG